MFGYLIVMVIGLALGLLAQAWIKRSYSKWSKQMSRSGLTGAQTARMILDRNNLGSVRVEPVAGTLTDHYDPGAKVIRLSQENYSGNSIAGVSVAAHEAGHAVQDAIGYMPMKLRAGLFPIVNISSQLWFMAFFAAIMVGIGSSTGQLLVTVAIVMFLGVLAFQLVTLPVEVNASTRAYSMLTNYGVLSHGEAGGTKRVLTAAAFTYIAAALTSVITLVWLLLASRQ
ncbi:zinc metallopeptidase [Rubrobacter indicoceani]|uniref:zinc metallopeptidase n=1 Tax=Rubrobacter indicoceani TaxID=2051957 RepID=UPI001F09B9C6|nr:zinc metallopeptidase [Rubrobacter indicoceani]